jgi:hypothetical protein
MLKLGVITAMGFTAALLTGCDGAEPNAPAPEVVLAFRPDVPAVGDEAYLCFGFDPALLAGSPLRAIRIETETETEAPPASAPVVLHHVSLYAVRAAFPEGPVRCEAMPDEAVGLYVGVPGGDPLELPAGIAIALPEGTQRLVVQAHVLRLAEGPATPGRLHLVGVAEAPEHLAAWMPLRVPVPAIRPHHEEISTQQCTVSAPLHFVATWPHMHRLGAAFHGAVLPKTGGRRAFLDVDPWRFEEQRVYPLHETAEAGDAIESTCVWNNPGNEYVFAGPSVDDEMCGQAVVAWPAADAFCGP